MTGFLRIVYSAFTIVFLATTLQANSTIVPVIVDVEASGRGVVEITNLRTQPTLYNIEVLKWAVVDGVDEYEDTRLFIVSPPSFKLHPGKMEKSTPRVSRQARHPIGTDLSSYRRGSPLGGEESCGRHIDPRCDPAPCLASLCCAANPRRAEIELDHHNPRRHRHPTGHQLRQPAGHRGERWSASEPQPRKHARLCQQQLGTCFGGIVA